MADDCATILIAAVIIVALVLVIAAIGKICADPGRARMRSGYLVGGDRYFDLDGMGVRGSPYAMSECVGCS